MPTANEISMLQAARTAGITSRDELANFMAQIGAESGGLTQLQESFRYTQGLGQISVNVPSVLREGREVAEAARLEALAGRPQELARLMYGGRMGNDDAGDGYLYRGRGFIQLTGENNYRATGTALNLDLVGHPELAADRDNASRIALSFWQTNVPQADRDDVSAAARAVNGGATGLLDRHNRFDAWHAQLTPEFIADLDAGRIRPGNGVGPAVGQDASADGALRRFETGQDVRELRADLHALGIRYDRNHVVGAGNIYDANTEQGVRRFQEQHGLPVTGRAGPETLAAIQEAVQRQQQHVPQQPVQHPDQPRMRNPAGGGNPERDDRQDRDGAPQPPHRGAQLMTDPDHIANPSWLQAERAMGLAAFDPDGKLTPDQRERTTAGMVAGVLLDTRTNMSRIERVDASTIPDAQTGLPKYLIAGQGDPTTGHYRRVAVDVSEVMNTPVEQSSDTAKTAMHTREQKQVQELAQAQTVNQDALSGPTMRIGARSPGSDTG